MTIEQPTAEERNQLPALTHRAKADRLAYLLQVARDLERFAPDEDADRMLRHVHRGLGRQLGADLGFAWRLDRGATIQASYHLCWTGKGQKRLALVPRDALSEEALRFARDRKSPGDPTLLLTAVESSGRPIGVLAFLRPGKAFGRSDALFAADAAEILGRSLTHREQERLYEIRERILRKVLLQLRPADVLYQVLHGLRRLLRFDHSASVQTYDPIEATLSVRAETIAWTKAKSLRIGEKLPVDPESRAYLQRIERSHLLDPSRPPEDLPAPLLESLCGSGPGVPPARSMIVASLTGPDGLVGVLVIRDLAPGAFVPADSAIIDSFLHILSATARHYEFFRQQQSRLLEAERRTALGDLARAISHDLNNAFGVIQPLLETLRGEAEAGTINLDRLRTDLEVLGQYVSASLRIFQGLLSFSRGSIEPARQLQLQDCVESVLALLARSFEAQGVVTHLSIDPDLPRFHARRQDMEQLFLNLLTNARESMPDGGALEIEAALELGPDGENLHIRIHDTGRGIPEELLPRIFEPFFTTKHGGTGLGLDICRSIVWEYDGQLWLESKPGCGTTAHVRLPREPRRRQEVEV